MSNRASEKTLVLKKPASKRKMRKAAWDWLEENFIAFEKNLRPLAIGVSKDINKRIREDTEFEYAKRHIRFVVRGFFTQKVYKKALIESKYRYTLDGGKIERTLDDLENSGYAESK